MIRNFHNNPFTHNRKESFRSRVSTKQRKGPRTSQLAFATEISSLWGSMLGGRESINLTYSHLCNYYATTEFDYHTRGGKWHNDWCVVVQVTLKASTRLHDRVFRKILLCPMSFFDVTPVGRLLNRFSKDMDEGCLLCFWRPSPKVDPGAFSDQRQGWKTSKRTPWKCTLLCV